MRVIALIAGICLALASITSAFYANYQVARGGYPPYSPIGRPPYGNFRGRYWGDDDFDDGFDNGGYGRYYNNYRGWGS